MFLHSIVSYDLIIKRYAGMVVVADLTFLARIIMPSMLWGVSQSQPGKYLLTALIHAFIYRRCGVQSNVAFF